MKYKQGELVSFSSVQDRLMEYVKKNAPESLNTMKSMLSELSLNHGLSTRNAKFYCNSSDEKEDNPKSSTFVFKTEGKTIVVGLNGIIQYNDDDIYKHADKDNSHFINKAKVSFFNGTTIESCSLHSKMDKSMEQWQETFGNISEIFIEPTIPENAQHALNKTHTPPSSPFLCSKKVLGKESNYNVSYRNGNRIQFLPEQTLEGDISILEKDPDTDTTRNRVFYTGVIDNFDKYGNGIIKTKDGNNIFVKSNRNGEFVGYSDHERTNQISVTIGNVTNKLARVLLNANASTDILNARTNQLQNVLHAAFSTSNGKDVSLYYNLNAKYSEYDRGFFLHAPGCNIHGTSKDVFVGCDSNGGWFVAVKDNNASINEGYEVYFSNGAIFKGSCVIGNGDLKFGKGILCKSGKYLEHNSQQTLSDILEINFDTVGQEITEEVKQRLSETDFVGLEESNGKYESVVYGHMFENSIINNSVANIEPGQAYKNKIIENVFSQLSSSLQDLFNNEPDLHDYIEDIKQKKISDEALRNLEKALNKIKSEAQITGSVSVKGKKITDLEIEKERERLLYAKYLYDKFVSADQELNNEDIDNHVNDNDDENEDELENEADKEIENECYELEKQQEALARELEEKQNENKEKEKDIEEKKKEEEEEEEDVDLQGEDDYEEEPEEEPEEELLIPNISTLQQINALVDSAKALYKDNRTNGIDPENDTIFKTLCAVMTQKVKEKMYNKMRIAEEMVKVFILTAKGQKDALDGSNKCRISDEQFNYLSEAINEVLAGVVVQYDGGLRKRYEAIEKAIKNSFSRALPGQKTVLFSSTSFDTYIRKSKEIEANYQSEIDKLLTDNYDRCSIFYPDSTLFLGKYANARESFKKKYGSKKSVNKNAKKNLETSNYQKKQTVQAGTK